MMTAQQALSHFGWIICGWGNEIQPGTIVTLDDGNGFFPADTVKAVIISEPTEAEESEYRRVTGVKRNPQQRFRYKAVLE